MPPSVIGTSLLFSVAPLGVFLLFLRWQGRDEREPFPLVAGAFFFGAVAAIALGIWGSGLLSRLLGVLLDHRPAPLLEALVAAPLAEELGKGLVLLLLYAAGPLEHAAVGLFYGAAAGLGFAMSENCFYFLLVYDKGGPEAWRGSLLLRTLFSAVMHVAASATFGFILGTALEFPRGSRKRRLAPAMALLCAWSIHALWNGTLFVGQATRDAALPGQLFLTVPPIAAVLLLLTELSLRGEGRILLRQLLDEADRGLVPPAHAEIAASHLRRRAFLSGPGPRRAYLRALCALALRKERGDEDGAQRRRAEVRRLFGMLGAGDR